MRKAYKHNKSGRIIFVLFDVYETIDGICGIDNKHKCDIKHYTCLDEQYKRETTTMDNLVKNYHLIVEPVKRMARQLEYIKI